MFEPRSQEYAIVMLRIHKEVLRESAGAWGVGRGPIMDLLVAGGKGMRDF